MDLTRLESEYLDNRTKGLPGHTGHLRLRDVGMQGWNVIGEDLPLPLLTLDRLAIENNIAVMQGYCERRGVLLAPHGKTTMAPQVFDMQLRAGAWAITAASVQQLQVYRHYGVDRVLLANQVVGKRDLEYILTEMRSDLNFELFLFVDSPSAVRVLMDGIREHDPGRSISVLLEFGYRGGRAGVRNLEEARTVIAAIAQTGGTVRLAGVAGFEGLLPIARFRHGVDNKAAAASNSQLTSYLASISDAVDQLLETGLLDRDFFVTAGGSAAFDQVVRSFSRRWDGATVILRSGCYVTHDHGMYAQTSPLSTGADEATEAGFLRPALRLWSYVLSRPEPELALLGFGRRDASFDYGLPVPLESVSARARDPVTLAGSQITQLNDQHAYLEVPANCSLAVGDRVVCGISHPCTVFDKWQIIPIIEQNGRVSGAIRTFF